MKKKDSLTKNQHRVYEYIKSYLAQKDEAPTLKEIAGELSATSLRTVTQYLETLERKGLIRRSRYAKRGIRLVEDEKPAEEIIQVPVFASAGCGSPSVIAERTFDEYIPVSASLTQRKKRNVFIIKAIGNSLNEAGVNDGDFVLVERTLEVNSGELVVVILNNNAVIKKISFANNAVILNPVSSDKSHQPIIMRHDFEVFGRVIDVIRVEQSDDYQFVPIENT